MVKTSSQNNAHRLYITGRKCKVSLGMRAGKTHNLNLFIYICWQMHDTDYPFLKYFITKNTDSLSNKKYGHKKKNNLKKTFLKMK